MEFQFGRLRFILLAGLSACLFSAGCGSSETQFQNRVGWLDLSTTNLHRDVVLLDGLWEFQPHRFGALREEQIVAAPVPGSWNDLIPSGSDQPMGGHGYGTYRLRLTNSDWPNSVALRVGEIGTAYRLLVDEREVCRRGLIGSASARSQPDTRPALCFFSTDKDTVEITIEVSNFDYRKGGIWHPIRIGSAAVLVDRVTRNRLLDTMTVGALLIIGFYHVAFMLLRPGDRRPLYFGLACIVIGLRASIVDTRLLLLVFPDLPWDVYLRIEYLTFAAAAPLFGAYLHGLFPRCYSRYYRDALGYVFAAYAIFVLVTPSAVFTHSILYYQLHLVAFLVYSAVAVVIATVRREEGARLVLATGLVLAGAALNDILHTQKVIRTMNAIAPALLFFVAGQALLLSRRFAKAFETIENLVATIDSKNRRLERTNTELVSLKSDLESRVSERTRELVQERDRAETAVATRTMFLANMSHEIRTPMHAIIGFADLLSDSGLNEEQRNYLGIMQRSAASLLSIINDILDYTKIESGKLELERSPFSMRSLVDTTIEAFSLRAAEQGNELEQQVDERLTTDLIGDPNRLGQVLNNLLSNAVKFTSNGSVRLRVDCVEEIGDEVRVRFAVEDTGIGISAEHSDRVFESFTQADSATTRKYGGSGLGLPITRLLVEAMGGRLNLESNPGEGSRFWFVVPFLKNTTPSPVRKESTQFQRLDGLRLLIVEDTEDNVQLLANLLNRWAVEADVARDGKEGVQMARAGHYHAILMDLQMPVMDGYEAARSIRSFDSETPIFALTAAALSEVRERVFSVGMNDFISKPFRKEVLYERLSRMHAQIEGQA